MDQALTTQLLVVIAALLLMSYPAAQAIDSPQLPSANDLVSWVVKYGGQVHQNASSAASFTHVKVSYDCLKLVSM